MVSSSVIGVASHKSEAVTPREIGPWTRATLATSRLSSSTTISLPSTAPTSSPSAPRSTSSPLAPPFHLTALNTKLYARVKSLARISAMPCTPSSSTPWLPSPVCVHPPLKFSLGVRRRAERAPRTRTRRMHETHSLLFCCTTRTCLLYAHIHRFTSQTTTHPSIE